MLMIDALKGSIGAFLPAILITKESQNKGAQVQ